MNPLAIFRWGPAARPRLLGDVRPGMFSAKMRLQMRAAPRHRRLRGATWLTLAVAFVVFSSQSVSAQCRMPDRGDHACCAPALHATWITSSTCPMMIEGVPVLDSATAPEPSLVHPPNIVVLATGARDPASPDPVTDVPVPLRRGGPPLRIQHCVLRI